MSESKKRILRFITDEEDAAEDEKIARLMKMNIHEKLHVGRSFKSPCPMPKTIDTDRKLSDLLLFENAIVSDLPIIVFSSLQKMNDLSLNYCLLKRPQACKIFKLYKVYFNLNVLICY
jgi:hypothetical protein